MKSEKTVFETVGGTPLLKLPAISRELDGVELYAKAEYFNPTGSVKDRAAKAMILDGIARGLLTHDKTIIDATSGNTGIAYAALGAALGYKVALCLPANATEERKKLINRLNRIEGQVRGIKKMVENDVLGHPIVEVVLLAGLSAIVNGLLSVLRKYLFVYIFVINFV